MSSLSATSFLTRPSSLAWAARLENHVSGIQYLLKSEFKDSSFSTSFAVINPAYTRRFEIDLQAEDMVIRGHGTFSIWKKVTKL